MLVPALASTISRFEAVRLSALRAADRARVGDWQGWRDTASWAAAMTGEKRGKARGDCELAGKLAASRSDRLGVRRRSGVEVAGIGVGRGPRPSEAEQADLLAAAGSLSLTELERRVERFNLDRDRPASRRSCRR